MRTLMQYLNNIQPPILHERMSKLPFYRSVPDVVAFSSPVRNSNEMCKSKWDAPAHVICRQVLSTNVCNIPRGLPCAGPY